MDIQEQLRLEHSKSNTVIIAEYVCANPEAVSEIIELFINGDIETSQRVSWVLGHIFDRNKSLILPFVPLLVKNLVNNNQHTAIKRNTWRILQDLTVPEKQEGLVLDLGFTDLTSQKTPIAIKVFAMTALSNIVKKHPELSEELRITIEDQMPYASAGFKSRGKKILKKLDSIRKKNNI